MPGFFVWCSLVVLWSDIVLTVLWTILYHAPVWYIESATALRFGKLLHNYDWYSLTWFPLNACFTAHIPSIIGLSLRLSSSPPILEHAPCLYHDFDTAQHYDHPLPCNWTHNICTMSLQSWPGLHCIVCWNMTSDTASGRYTVREKIF